MTYLGIDYHKADSFVTALDEHGKKIFHGRLPNQEKAFETLLGKLPGPFKAVIEASRTWQVMYELLQNVGVPTEVAHTTRVRAIAEAQVKTDARDSEILAYLLKANLIPKIHVPDTKICLLRRLVRQRIYLVQTKTRLKNRIHQLLDRNRIVNPGFSDIFGVAGRQHLKRLILPETEELCLEGMLNHLEFIFSQIKELDTLICEKVGNLPQTQLLESLPGVGKVFSALMALEIDSIERFQDSAHLASYAGLVPRTYASGGRSYQGPLVAGCNRFLKWAFVEAAWSALTKSVYCRHFFERIKKRLGAKAAIVALARRLVQIAYLMLKEKRLYEERPFQVAFTNL
ncbi:MAG: IS110 family transposase [Candidatus Aminicenantes bacterium]|nr:IS110 family transposase [Candidatus Aminicenantes bacterium]